MIRKIMLLFVFICFIVGCARTGENSYYTSLRTIVDGISNGKFIVNDPDKMTLEDFFLFIMQPDNLTYNEALARAEKYNNEKILVSMPVGNDPSELDLTVVEERDFKTGKPTGYLEVDSDLLWTIKNISVKTFRNSFHKIKAVYAGGDVEDFGGATSHLNIYYILYADGKEPAYFWCQVVGNDDEFGCRYWNIQAKVPQGVKKAKSNKYYYDIFPVMN